MAERRLHHELADWPLELDQIVACLESHAVDYVILGGFAALIHGMPLPTFDLDIVLAPSARARKRLLEALDDIGAQALIDQPDDAQPLDARHALQAGIDVSFYTPSGYLDVISAPAGVTSYGWLRRGAKRFQLTSASAPLVADLRDIIASKIALGRERDFAKLPALEALAAAHE